MSRSLRWLLVLLPFLVAGVAVWLAWPDDAKALDVSSDGPTFADVGELVAASDLIVVGTFEASEPGRIVGDPANGIATTLYSVDIEQTIAGDEPAELVVEHETALADGTSITIDGTPPPRQGERALLFLIAGDTEAFPHHAIVGTQGRYPLSGATFTPLNDDPLVQTLAALPADELLEALSRNP